ncbi:HD domain-containing protein [Vallitalea okinawensis]|uniref:HD domain-containing protein n=1 Tax=Vallitalea okinawensis TaxID=2078660 RepID=UPI000CFC3498|nr:HD domain-containing protein [Vallitalea okinawensis]
MNTENQIKVEEIITFIKELERLKNITRTAWTSEGKQESVAEHSWRLAMLALVLTPYIPEVNFSKVISMCLVHDLGEAYEGDISATIPIDQDEKLINEERDILRLINTLPKSSKEMITSLWKEYNEAISIEAKIAKSLDKMETIIQHNQGKNPSDFNYAFNLTYGTEYVTINEIIEKLRKIIDDDTHIKLSDKQEK